MTVPIVDPYDMAVASRLPVTAVDWRCRADRAVLLIHDMRDDVISSFVPGRSPVVELVHNLTQLRDTCRELRVPVLYSARSSSLGSTIAAVAPGPGDTIVGEECDRHYALLRDILDSYGRDQLLVTGVRAHVACLMAAAGSHLAGIEMFSVADATADLSLDDHQNAVLGAAEYGAMVTNTSRVIGQLLGVLG